MTGRTFVSRCAGAVPVVGWTHPRRHRDDIGSSIGDEQINNAVRAHAASVPVVIDLPERWHFRQAISASNHRDGSPVVHHDQEVEPDRSYTVTEFMVAFRKALVALLPSADSIGVAWADGDAYDDWELIEEVLFEVFVAAGVRGDLALFGSSRPFAPYGFDGLRYSEWSWVEVLAAGRPGPLALVRLNSPRDFSDVNVVRLDGRGGAREQLVVPWTPDLEFVAQLRAPGGTLTRADAVTPIESVVRHPWAGR